MDHLKAQINTPISLAGRLEAYRNTLGDGDRRRCKTAFSQLEAFLGKGLRVPNDNLIFDLPNRFRKFLRGEGLSEETVKNYSKWVGRAIQWICQLEVDLKNRQSVSGFFPTLSPDPNDLQQRFHKGYIRFVEWFGRTHGAGRPVNKQVFREYQRSLLKNLKYDTARSYYSALVTFWGERAGRWELPLLDIPEMQRKGPGRYGLNRNLWPAKVKMDFNRFFTFSRMEETVEGRSSKVFRDATTEKAYVTVLSGFLGHLTNIRGEDLSKCGLRELIRDEQRVFGFISWHKAERSRGKDASIHQKTLERFATILSELWDDPIATVYRECASQLDPVRKDPRLSETLIPFRDLLRGGLKALEEARAAAADPANSSTPIRRQATAVRYHDALLFCLALFRPLRASNIINLMLGSGLIRRPDGHYDITVSSAEEKGRKQYRIQFPLALEPYLQEYLTTWRPLLNRHGSQRVFMTNRGGPLTPKLLNDRTVRLGKQYLHIQKLNPHFFRALTVSSYLADHPQQFEVMRQLLGHRSLSTTLRYYIHIHALHASRRAAEFARENCEEFCRLGRRFAL